MRRHVLLLCQKVSLLTDMQCHSWEGKHALHMKTVNRGLQNIMLVFERL